jgi:hypothetical protein
MAATTLNTAPEKGGGGGKANPTPAKEEKKEAEEHILLEGVQTAGDGNCAFNAFALGLAEGVLAGKIECPSDFYTNIVSILSPNPSNVENFKKWLEMRTPLERQQKLQAILRKIAVDSINKDYGSLYDYHAMLVSARDNPSQDDTFRYHEEIQKKMEEVRVKRDKEKQALEGTVSLLTEFPEIVNANLDEKQKAEIIKNCNDKLANLDKHANEKLCTWFDATGKEIFFKTLEQSASGPSDRARWGSDVELAALARYFNINIRWKKGSGGLAGGRIIGVGSGFIRGLSDDEKRELCNLGIGDREGDCFKIQVFHENSFSDEIDLAVLDTLRAYVEEQSEVELPKTLGENEITKEVIDQLNQYRLLNGTKILLYKNIPREITDKKDEFKAIVEFIEKTRQGKSRRVPLELAEKDRQWLKDRGIITTTGELEGGNNCPNKDAILRKLGKISEALKEKVKSHFRSSPVIFEVRNSGSHWTYYRIVANHKNKDVVASHLEKSEQFVPLPVVSLIKSSKPNALDKNPKNEDTVESENSSLATASELTGHGEHLTSELKRALHGSVYQLKVLMLFLKRGLTNGYSFKLATEFAPAGKFDDVFFQYLPKNAKGSEFVYRYLQAKHKLEDSSKIKLNDLLKEKDDDFSLQKYFVSHRKIKKNLKAGESIKDFIICTNINFDFDENKKGDELPLSTILDLILEPDDILKEGKRYRFKNFSQKEEVLYPILKRASKLHKLAIKLSKHVVDDKTLELRDELFKSYHGALAEEVLDIEENKFKATFINDDAALSPKIKNFRKIFVEQVKKELAKKNKDLTLKDIFNKNIKISSTFGRVFQAEDNYEINEPEKFVAELVSSLIEARDSGITTIKINRLIKDNIQKLAGYIIVRAKRILRISKKFLKDEESHDDLPAELQQFRILLKESLLKKGLSLEIFENFQFEIKKFKTCEEGQVNVPLTLPDDMITDKEIEDFFKDLVFAVEQSGTDIDNLIKKEVEEEFNLLDTDFVVGDLQKKMLKWMAAKEGRFLSHDEGKEFFKNSKQIINKLILVGPTIEYRSILEQSKIAFNTPIELKKLFKNQLLIYVTTDTNLASVKVYEGLKKDPDYVRDNSYIFMRLNSCFLLKKRLIHAFEGPSNLLIIECNDVITNRETQKLLIPLIEIINLKKNKKILVITKENKLLQELFVSLLNKGYAYDKHDDKTIEFSDLTLSSQNTLKEKPILFQGQATNITGLVGNENLINFFNSIPLLNFINSDNIVLDTSVPFLKSFERSCYIDRQLQRSIKIDPKCLSNLLDYFIISGATEESLKKYLPANETFRSMETDVPTDKIRYIFVTEENASLEFDRLRSHKYSIHWLKLENDHFTWKKSHGPITGLREHVVERSAVCYKTDETKDKVIVVAAEPGMGKSTEIINFIEKIKRNNPSMWVLKIDLKKWKNEIDSMDFSHENCVFDFIVKIRNLNLLAQCLLKYQLEIQGNIAIFVDGFDEISPSQKTKILQFLKTIKKNTRATLLFVATRIAMKVDLEDTLGVLAYSLTQFSSDNIKEFLISFWKGNSRLDLTNEGRLIKYANRILELFSSSAQDENLIFMGIPLQARLFAEAFQEKFEEFYKSDSEEMVLPENLDMIDLYQKFIERKYAIYLKEKINIDFGHRGGLEASLSKSLSRTHQLRAIELLFPQYKMNFSEREENFFSEDELNAVGIIQFIEGKLDFVHRTFAEFFVAKKLSRKIIKNPESSESNLKLIQFLYQAENRLICYFFIELLIIHHTDSDISYELTDSPLDKWAVDVCGQKLSEHKKEMAIIFQDREFSAEAEDDSEDNEELESQLKKSNVKISSVAALLSPGFWNEVVSSDLLSLITKWIGNNTLSLEKLLEPIVGKGVWAKNSKDKTIYFNLLGLYFKVKNLEYVNEIILDIPMLKVPYYIYGNKDILNWWRFDDILTLIEGHHSSPNFDEIRTSLLNCFDGSKQINNNRLASSRNNILIDLDFLKPREMNKVKYRQYFMMCFAIYKNTTNKKIGNDLYKFIRNLNINVFSHYFYPKGENFIFEQCRMVDEFDIGAVKKIFTVLKETSKPYVNFRLLTDVNVTTDSHVLWRQEPEHGRDHNFARPVLKCIGPHLNIIHVFYLNRYVQDDGYLYPYLIRVVISHIKNIDNETDLRSVFSSVLVFLCLVEAREPTMPIALATSLVAAFERLLNSPEINPQANLFIRILFVNFILYFDLRGYVIQPNKEETELSTLALIASNGYDAKLNISCNDNLLLEYRQIASCFSKIKCEEDRLQYFFNVWEECVKNRLQLTPPLLSSSGPDLPLLMRSITKLSSLENTVSLKQGTKHKLVELTRETSFIPSTTIGNGDLETEDDNGNKRPKLTHNKETLSCLPGHEVVEGRMSNEGVMAIHFTEVNEITKGKLLLFTALTGSTSRTLEPSTPCKVPIIFSNNDLPSIEQKYTAEYEKISIFRALSKTEEEALVLQLKKISGDTPNKDILKTFITNIILQDDVRKKYSEQVRRLQGNVLYVHLESIVSRLIPYASLSTESTIKDYLCGTIRDASKLNVFLRQVERDLHERLINSPSNVTGASSAVAISRRAVPDTDKGITNRIEAINPMNSIHAQNLLLSTPAHKATLTKEVRLGSEERRTYESALEGSTKDEIEDVYKETVPHDNHPDEDTDADLEEGDAWGDYEDDFGTEDADEVITTMAKKVKETLKK